MSAPPRPGVLSLSLPNVLRALRAWDAESGNSEAPTDEAIVAPPLCGPFDSAYRCDPRLFLCLAEAAGVLPDALECLRASVETVEWKGRATVLLRCGDRVLAAVPARLWAEAISRELDPPKTPDEGVLT